VAEILAAKHNNIPNQKVCAAWKIWGQIEARFVKKNKPNFALDFCF
jgi:hypothetical protein